MAAIPRLMLVAERARVARGNPLEAYLRAIEGGVEILQVREPTLDEAAVDALLRQLLPRIPAGIEVLVHRYGALALRYGAGLHLPAAAPFDGERARQVREGGGRVGRSIHDLREAARSVEEGVDYAVLGTIYETPSKPGRVGAGPALVQRVSSVHPTLRLYAIGGVRADRVAELVGSGAWGIAVSGAILSAPDAGEAARVLASELRGVAARG